MIKSLILSGLLVWLSLAPTITMTQKSPTEVVRAKNVKRHINGFSLVDAAYQGSRVISF